MIRYNFMDGTTVEYPISLSTFFWIATQIGCFQGPRSVTCEDYYRDLKDGGYLYIFERPMCKHIYDSTHKHEESREEKEPASIVIDHVFMM